MTTSSFSTRLPSNHQIVYDVVRSQDPGIHAPVGDIFQKAKLRKPGLGYSTVYRALDRLRDLGLILQVHVPGTNAALYEPARSSHAHFVCTGCGTIDDIDCDLGDSEGARVIRARGASVDDVAMTIHGRCPACQARGQGSPRE